MGAVECNPFSWAPRAERRRLVLLFKDEGGHIHVACAFLSKLVKHCSAQATKPPADDCT
jgi:hypothetical protein